MARDNRLALSESKLVQARELTVNVLLVLKDEWLSCQHGFGWFVRWANVNNGEVSTSSQESSRFIEDSCSTFHWDFMEAVHDSDQIEGEVWEFGFF